MRSINFRQVIIASLLPNIIAAVALVYTWGRGELHVQQVWRNTSSAGLAALYLLLIVIIYFGIISWVCMLLNAVERNYPLTQILLHPVTQAARPSPILFIIWLVLLVFDGVLSVPFIMTRAHAVHSTLLEFGSIGYWFGLVFATLSAYGFLWNLTERLFNRHAENADQ